MQARLLLVFPSRQCLHHRSTLSPRTVHVYIFFLFLLFRCVYIVVLLVAVFLTSGIFQQRGVTGNGLRTLFVVVLLLLLRMMMSWFIRPWRNNI